LANQHILVVPGITNDGALRICVVPRQIVRWSSDGKERDCVIQPRDP